VASVRTLGGAFDFEPRSIPGRRFLAQLGTYVSAIREAGAAAHAYDELVRRGTPHAEAVQRVFDEHFNGRR
jgi:hypothetical protein